MVIFSWWCRSQRWKIWYFWCWVRRSVNLQIFHKETSIVFDRQCRNVPYTTQLIYACTPCWPTQPQTTTRVFVLSSPSTKIVLSPSTSYFTILIWLFVYIYKFYWNSCKDQPVVKWEQCRSNICPHQHALKDLTNHTILSAYCEHVFCQELVQKMGFQRLCENEKM